MSEHARREWCWEMAEGVPQARLIDGTNWMSIEAYGADEAHMRVIAAAANSYRKHCGANAVECAESDLLGEALTICERLLAVCLQRAVDDAHIANAIGFSLEQFPELQALYGKARAMLAKATKEGA